MMRVVTDLSDRELAALERGRRKAELVAWLRRQAASRDGEMAWYVVATRCRADSVEAELRDAGIEAVCPMERRWKRFPRSTRRYAVDYPMLGNHLFVRLLVAEVAWVGVMTFDSIVCLLGSGERPVPVAEREMAWILQTVDQQGVQHCSPGVGLEVGDSVIHPVGTFAELHGKVLEVDEMKRTALVEAVLFGRTIATRCGIDDLEKLS